MKKILLIALLLSAFNSISAQTWDEWFRQKDTQKKYLVQQIAAFKIYTEYLSKGYKIARASLHAIQDIKNGDFNLHSDYFTTLQNVSPRIKRYTKIAAIISLQLNNSNASNKTIRNCKRSNQMTSAEIKYIQTVFNKVLNDCTDILELLHQILSDNNLSLKEDERISVIDKLYEEMQDHYVFVRTFGNSAEALCALRINENNELIIEKKLNEIK